MESIRGKHAMRVDAAILARQIAGHTQILVDLGTGDGRFVRHVAETWPHTFAIGVDLCRANLSETSRRAPANALYLVASAHALPRELHSLATHITINFPWGDLLAGLLTHDPRLLAGLSTLGRPGTRLEIRLNGGALAESGWTLPAAATEVIRGVRIAGFAVESPRLLDARELRTCPTTWAHRLAFGRDPRALYLQGVKIESR